MNNLEYARMGRRGRVREEEIERLWSDLIKVQIWVRNGI